MSPSREAFLFLEERYFVLWSLLQAHCKAYVVKSFTETLSMMTGKLRAVMENVCRLYAITGLIRCLGDFLEVSFVDGRNFVCTRWIEMPQVSE